MQMYRSAQGGGISVSWKSRSHFADSFGNTGNSRHFQGCQLFFRQPCSLITVQHFVVHTSIIHIDAPKWHLGYGYKRFHSNRVEHGNEPIFSHFQTVQQDWIRERPYPQHICVHSLDDPRNQEHERLSQAPCILWVWRGDLRIGKTLGCYILEQRQAANLRCAERSNRICP